jgi:hypothetical protein
MRFEIRAGGKASRYSRSDRGTVLVKLTDEPTRTIAGYLVLRPEQAESLVIEMHHWLDNQKGK